MIEFLIKLQLIELTLTIQRANLVIINQILSEEKKTLEAALSPVAAKQSEAA